MCVCVCTRISLLEELVGFPSSKFWLSASTQLNGGTMAIAAIRVVTRARGQVHGLETKPAEKKKDRWVCHGCDVPNFISFFEYLEKLEALGEGSARQRK